MYVLMYDYFNEVDYSMWEILQKKVYKTRITYLDEPKQHLRTKRARLDHIVISQLPNLCTGIRTIDLLAATH